MIKKNTLSNNNGSNNNAVSNTNRTVSNLRNTRNASNLKSIHPSSSHKKIQPNKISANNSTFLLPSSEFFVVDKDSLVLSESDIFQTNLSRKISPASATSDNEEEDVDDDEMINFDLINEKENIQSKKSSENSENYTKPFDKSDNYLKTKLIKSKLSNNENIKLHTYPIVPLKSLIPPVNVSSPSHVSTSSQSEKVQQPLDKGLRHFSAKVCAKVEEKGVTTYNEVADDLVHEIGLEMGKCDHKNIRRRVYDALNVLMAIDIICKEKKEIRWLGLPNEAADDLKLLEAERSSLQERINEKNRNLREVLRRCISLKNLIDRNSSDQHQQGDKLPLPFILISAARDCHVHCEMLEDRTQYFFEFNTAFQINEDIELMRLMGLDTGRIERIKSFFPKELVAQVLMLCLNNNNTINNSGSQNNSVVNLSNFNHLNQLSSPHQHNPLESSPVAVNSSVFAPIINNEDLNLGDLETFNSSSL